MEAHGHPRTTKARVGRFLVKAVPVAGGSITRFRKLMPRSGLGASSPSDKSAGVLGDEHVLTRFLCAARCIETVAV